MLKHRGCTEKHCWRNAPLVWMTDISVRLQSLAWIIHECRHEAAETEACRGFSQVRTTQAYLRSVEETEREKPRRARRSAAVVVVHE
jgi:hypothetical protein